MITRIPICELFANPVPNDTRVVRERRRGPGATITRCQPGGGPVLGGWSWWGGEGEEEGGGGDGGGHVPEDARGRNRHGVGQVSVDVVMQVDDVGCVIVV